jgi:hypothetical protein
MDALRVDASFNDPTYYHSENFPNNPGSQTIVMPNYGEVHWFVLRSTRGDHPSKSPFISPIGSLTKFKSTAGLI